MDPRKTARFAAKQCAVPGEQTFSGEWSGEIPRRVESHLDHAVHLAIRRNQPADIHAEMAGDRRTHLGGVELLSFDFARAHRLFGQITQHGLLVQREA